jgi:predicted ester cyclase
MSAANKALVLKAIKEIFNAKHQRLEESIYATNCKGSSPDGRFTGMDEFKSLVDRYAAVFSDLRFDIQLIIGEDDWVAVSYHCSARHTGVLRGFQPTMRSLSMPGFVLSRVENDRIVEQYFMWDNLEARRQLQLWQNLERRDVKNSSAFTKRWLITV